MGCMVNIIISVARGSGNVVEDPLPTTLIGHHCCCTNDFTLKHKRRGGIVSRNYYQRLTKVYFVSIILFPSIKMYIDVCRIIIT